MIHNKYKAFCCVTVIHTLLYIILAQILTRLATPSFIYIDSREVCLHGQRGLGTKNQMNYADFTIKHANIFSLVCIWNFVT